jgi:hypothetical protein
MWKSFKFTFVTAALMALALCAVLLARVPTAAAFGGLDAVGQAINGGGGARPGGGGVSLDCPPGQFVIGFNGRKGDWIDALGVICAPLDGNRFGSLGSGSILAIHGKQDGGLPFPNNAIVCPQGMAVDEVLFNMTRPPDGGHVDNIEFQCRDPNASPARDKVVTIKINSNDPDDFEVVKADEWYGVQCYGDTDGFATGINIRATDSVEALDLDCSTENIGTKSDKVVVTPTPPQYHPGKLGDVGATQYVGPQACIPPWIEVKDRRALEGKWVTQAIKVGDRTVLCARPAVKIALPTAPPKGASKSKAAPPPPIKLHWADPCFFNPRSLQCVMQRGGDKITICPNGKPRAANGTCPSSKSTVDLKPLGRTNGGSVAACPDGRPRLKTGLCPASSGGINLQPGWHPNAAPVWRR